ERAGACVQLSGGCGNGRNEFGTGSDGKVGALPTSPRPSFPSARLRAARFADGAPRFRALPRGQRGRRWTAYCGDCAFSLLARSIAAWRDWAHCASVSVALSFASSFGSKGLPTAWKRFGLPFHSTYHLPASTGSTLKRPPSI